MCKRKYDKYKGKEEVFVLLEILELKSKEYQIKR